jgi:hypothetical protein
VGDGHGTVAEGAVVSAGHDRALTVADAHLLARFEAQHVDRVAALVAVHQEVCPFSESLRQDVHQEQRGAVELGNPGVGRHVSAR